MARMAEESTGRILRTVQATHLTTWSLISTAVTAGGDSVRREQEEGTRWRQCEEGTREGNKKYQMLQAGHLVSKEYSISTGSSQRELISISLGHPWVDYLAHGKAELWKTGAWSSEMDSSLCASWRKLATGTECRDNVDAAARVPGTV